MAQVLEAFDCLPNLSCPGKGWYLEICLAIQDLGLWREKEGTKDCLAARRGCSFDCPDRRAPAEAGRRGAIQETELGVHTIRQTNVGTYGLQSGQSQQGRSNVSSIP